MRRGALLPRLRLLRSRISPLDRCPCSCVLASHHAACGSGRRAHFSRMPLRTAQRPSEPPPRATAEAARVACAIAFHRRMMSGRHCEAARRAAAAPTPLTRTRLASGRVLARLHAATLRATASEATPTPLTLTRLALGRCVRDVLTRAAAVHMGWAHAPPCCLPCGSGRGGAARCCRAHTSHTHAHRLWAGAYRILLHAAALRATAAEAARRDAVAPTPLALAHLAPKQVLTSCAYAPPR